MVNEPKSITSKEIVISFGDNNLEKKYTLDARALFTLRKRHAFLAAVHNAIIKQVRKVELTVVPIDPKAEYNEKTMERIKNFIKTGFGINGEKNFRGRMIDTKKWYGDAFAEIIKDSSSGEPIRIKYIQPVETMQIKADEYGDITGYPQVVDGVVNYTFAPDEIIHLIEHDDEYSMFGYSDIESLFVPLLLDMLADQYSIKKLENDATPSGILYPKSESTKQLSREELLSLRALFIEQIQNNPNKPVFLGREYGFIEMIKEKDIDFQELRRMVKEKIMSVYSVLPMQVAVVETGRLANPEQQIEIGEEYIKQELESIQETYNMLIMPQFQNSENLMFKFSELEPKLDAKKKEAEIKLINAQIAKQLSTIPDTFTKNEIRNIIDYEPLDDGDELISAPPSGFSGFSLSDNLLTEKTTKPFGGYDDFDTCVEQNSDKDNPEAYCAAIMQAAEGKSEKDFETKAFINHKITRAKGERKIENDFGVIYAKFIKDSIRLAKKEFPKQPISFFEKAKDLLIEKDLSAFEIAMGILVNKLSDKLQKSTKENSSDIFSSAKQSLGFSLNQNDKKAIDLLLSARKGGFDAVKSFSEKQKEGLFEVFKNAYEGQLNIDTMVSNMREFSDDETYKLTRIARTESHRFSTGGRIAGYQDLEERRGEQFTYNWVGPDDERTSDECKEILDGNPYPLDEIIRLTNNGVVHPNERHTIVRNI